MSESAADSRPTSTSASTSGAAAAESSATVATAAAAIEAAPNPTSFVEIIQLIQAGGKPTDIRTDIDDSAQAGVLPSASVLPQRAKPWEKQAEKAE